MNRASVSRSTTIWTLLALVIMTLCVASTVVDAINANFFTGRSWPGAYLVFACMLAAVDGWHVALSDFAQDRIRWPYRLLEFAGLFIFLVLPWNGPDLVELGTWARLAIWTLAGYEMIILARKFAKTLTLDLLRLNQPAVEAPSSKTQAVIPLSTRQIYIIAGGLAMLITIATVIGWARLNETETSLNLPASAIAVFIYSAIGLLLLGQAQFVILRNSWKESKASVSFGLHSHWLRANLLLITLLACMTFALPTPVSNTPNLLPTLEFRPTPTATPRFSPTPTLTPTSTPNSAPAPADQKPPDSSGNFLDNALGFLWNNLSLLLAQVVANTPTVFLSIAAGIILWLLWGFLRRRPDGQLSNPRRANQHTAPVAASQPARITIRRALTPRDQVYAYYMSLLQRARQSGLERQPGQTPYEHTAQLASELPDSREELNQLTQAFIEARYSQQNVEAEQVDQARTLWQRIRSTLRTYKQKSSRR